jgi:hypothetical protein
MDGMGDGGGMLTAERLASMAVKVWLGDRSVCEDLRKTVPRPEELEENAYGIVGRGPDGVAVGLPYGLEPPIALVQLGFLYAGPAWPLLDVFREANGLARKMWRDASGERRRLGRASAESAGGPGKVVAGEDG